MTVEKKSCALICHVHGEKIGEIFLVLGVAKLSYFGILTIFSDDGNIAASSVGKIPIIFSRCSYNRES